MESASQVPSTSREIHFSLRTALLALTATCLLLAPTHWFGSVYVVSAIFSAMLVSICTVLYRKSAGAAFGAAFVAVFLGLGFVLGSIVFFFHAVLNAIACMVLGPLRVRTRTFAGTLLALMVAVYSFSFYQGFTKAQELRVLQAKYPVISLSNRLAFEKSAAPDASTGPQPVQLATHVAVHLNEQDQSQRVNYFSCDGELRQLHENYQDEFARAAGFGFSRMGSLTYRIVDFKTPAPISLPTPVKVSKQPASAKELYDVHREAADSFTSPDLLGYVKDRNSVVGFLPHQVAAFSSGCECSPGAQQYWQIVRLELVGLLRTEEPRVYTAKTLPPMDQIADTPHRELNDFESAALPQLISQEDVVVDQTPERIRMLGALRAGNTCLQCHEGTRGKLLGAFSYELSPIAPPPSIPEPVEPHPADPSVTPQTPNYM